jgi:hypothetical protein
MAAVPTVTQTASQTSHRFRVLLFSNVHSEQIQPDFVEELDVEEDEDVEEEDVEDEEAVIVVAMPPNRCFFCSELLATSNGDRFRRLSPPPSDML